MLEQIEVDGFKSLNGFSLEIRPGLNILAGPNGAGKSNIILFFEFLSHLADGSVMQAVSKVGGAGAIFTHLGDGKLAQQLSFTIRGLSEYRSRLKPPGKKVQPRTMRYEYRAVIRLHLELATLSFQHQELRMFEAEPEQRALDFGAAKPALEVIWEAQHNGENKIAVFAEDPSILVPVYFRENDSAFNTKEFLEKSIGEECQDYSLFQILTRLVEPTRMINGDLVEGRAYNIDPNAVRQLEDIASEAGIKFDGSGLAATLFASKKALERHERPRAQRFLYGNLDVPADLVEQVSRYAQLINDNISSVDVDSNPFENKLRVWLLHKKSGPRARAIKMPISLASDGTVKWLALTAAVISSTSAFAIEEPENFLHPYMQTEIINMVRNQAESRRTRMFALMTTHSETLLNAANPQEVVVVNMVDGRTRADRPANVEELVREMSATGFGLGYFYVAGALE